MNFEEYIPVVVGWEVLQPVGAKVDEQVVPIDEEVVVDAAVVGVDAAQAAMEEENYLACLTVEYFKIFLLH